MPHIDAMKIEGRSKSEFYVGAVVKAYKHVRDAILNKTPINQNILNLVNIIPHREYRDGFLFHPLKEFPDGEGTFEKESVKTTTTGTAGPLFNRNYFGTCTPESISHAGKTYHNINPKEELRRGLRLKYLSPDAMGELEILDIIDKNGKTLEKADCNMRDIYIYTSLDVKGWECLYVEPEIK